MQGLVRGLQKQSISGREPFENQENVCDSGTESDEEELVSFSDINFLTKHNRESLISINHQLPTLCSSSPPQDTDSKDSFGKESGILSEDEIEQELIPEEKYTFPIMSMDDSNETNELLMTSSRTLRPRRCRIRVLVHRCHRHKSESDVELPVLRNGQNSPSNKRRAIKRPALDLDKMMQNRLDVPSKRERISSCSSAIFDH